MLSVAALTRTRSVDQSNTEQPSTENSGENKDSHESKDSRENLVPRRADSTLVLPAVLGAIVPDAAMFIFYVFEKFILRTSERDIWTTQYFLPAWQDFFDLFNSVPLTLVAMIIAMYMGRRGWAIFFASMLLHFACDLPVHHDDGHRHFWPISDWRFESPVSYWDRKHYGIYAASVELVIFVISYLVSLRAHTSRVVRVGLSILAAIHLTLAGMLVSHWLS